MWIYQKKLMYPVNIKKSCPQTAKYIISQYGGPDGELGASIRYLSQRFSMPCKEARAALNDIGTEELAHLEMVGTIVHQLIKDVPVDVIKREGLGEYYVDHETAIYPISAGGIPFDAKALQSKGDPIADLTEDLAAEQKARATYENILKLVDDPDVIDPIKFLREREVVHFQRFGEALRKVYEKMDEKTFYVKKPKLME